MIFTMIINKHQKKLTYQKNGYLIILEKLQMIVITTGTVKKPVPNLMNKNNCVIHYRNLQQCLELGTKL